MKRSSSQFESEWMHPYLMMIALLEFGARCLNALARYGYLDTIENHVFASKTARERPHHTMWTSKKNVAKKRAEPYVLGFFNSRTERCSPQIRIHIETIELMIRRILK